MASDGAQISGGRFLATRLLPGEDLIAGLHTAQVALGAPAVAVVTCVGSLMSVNLRHAGGEAGTAYEGPLEIVSLVGTVDPDHHHLHLSIADGDGAVRGGHLLPGSSVYTTAEIVVVALEDLSFDRVPCPLSSYRELVIRRGGDSDRRS